MDIQPLYAIYLDHSDISTDTRIIKPGSIFFALKGENFDGNSFALQALQQGASFAVVSDPSILDPRIILVDDTLEALQLLATHHRYQLNIPVIAITGSNGKTTTKELITTVLRKKYNVHATIGNLNNHIGVPLTILTTKPDTEILVCEMGANHIGEIALLCSIAAPTHGVITNIGNAHLEGFGSIDGVKKAKGELFDFLEQHDGFAFINSDDFRLSELGWNVNNKITYGFSTTPLPSVLFSYSAKEGEQGFTIKDVHQDFEVHSTMFGHYNAMNMLAACAIGRHFSVDDMDIKESLSNYIPGANRSEIVTKNNCLIVKDAYNANPSSMTLAIEAFASQYPKGWIILGDMKELGDASHASHFQIIKQVDALDFTRIYLVGQAFTKAFEQAEITNSRFTIAESIENIKSIWDWNACIDQAVLLKGSRSMHLEQLLEK